MLWFRRREDGHCRRQANSVSVFLFNMGVFSTDPISAKLYHLISSFESC